MSTKIKENNPIVYQIKGKRLSFDSPLVMAVINLTPDSFYDGGKYYNSDDVLRDAEEKINQGAAILDIGAASSRPGAPEISEEEEWSRLEKPLQQLRDRFPGIFISVDTYRSEIALKAYAEGADIINDISGGSMDADMSEVISELDVAYVLMHMQGVPKTMQQNPVYTNVFNEVLESVSVKIKKLNDLSFSKIIIDPGFGFGKTTEHNYLLLKELSQFNALGYPLLAGLSRKSMINKVIGTNPVTALNGTTVLNTIALLNGASVLRVHDVKEAVEAVKLIRYYKNI